jgi:GNAT superfamily N-acetyltransferase
MFTHRLAALDDLDALRAVMARAIAELQKGFLGPEQIAASHAVMGLDTQLVADGTYFIIEERGTLAGCGGWSHRATLYGGDHSKDLRDPAPLDPAVDAARIRAMYTHPDFARRGVGRLVMTLCEDAARAAGFRRAEMMATLAGEPLYRACGYAPIERVEAPGPGGVAVPLIRMGKTLDAG